MQNILTYLIANLNIDLAKVAYDRKSALRKHAVDINPHYTGQSNLNTSISRGGELTQLKPKKEFKNLKIKPGSNVRRGDHVVRVFLEQQSQSTIPEFIVIDIDKNAKDAVKALASILPAVKNTFITYGSSKDKVHIWFKVPDITKYEPLNNIWPKRAKITTSVARGDTTSETSVARGDTTSETSINGTQIVGDYLPSGFVFEGYLRYWDAETGTLKDELSDEWIAQNKPLHTLTQSDIDIINTYLLEKTNEELASQNHYTSDDLYSYTDAELAGYIQAFVHHGYNLTVDDLKKLEGTPLAPIVHNKLSKDGCTSEGLCAIYNNIFNPAAPTHANANVKADAFYAARKVTQYHKPPTTLVNSMRNIGMPVLENNYTYYRTATLACYSQTLLDEEERQALAVFWLKDFILTAPQYKQFTIDNYLAKFWTFAENTLPKEEAPVSESIDPSAHIQYRQPGDTMHILQQKNKHNLNVYSLNNEMVYMRGNKVYNYLPTTTSLGEITYFMYDPKQDEVLLQLATDKIDLRSPRFVQKHLQIKKANDMAAHYGAETVDALDYKTRNKVMKAAKEQVDKLLDKLHTLEPVQLIASVQRQQIGQLDLTVQPPTYNKIPTTPAQMVQQNEHITIDEIKSNILWQQYYYSIPEAVITNRHGKQIYMHNNTPFTQLTWFHFMLSIALYSQHMSPMGVYVFYGEQGAGKSNMTSLIPRLLFGQTAQEVQAKQVVGRFSPNFDQMRIATLTEVEFKQQQLSAELYEKLKILGDYKVRYPIERKGMSIREIELDLMVLVTSNYMPKIPDKQDRRWFPIEIKRSQDMPSQVLNKLQSDLRHMRPEHEDVLNFAKYLRWLFDNNYNRSELEVYFKTEVPTPPVKHQIQEASIASSKSLSDHIQKLEVADMFDYTSDDREEEYLQAILDRPAILYMLDDSPAKDDRLIIHRADVTFLINISLSEGARSKVTFDELVQPFEDVRACQMPYALKPWSLKKVNDIVNDFTTVNKMFKAIDQSPWHERGRFTKSLAYDLLLPHKSHLKQSKNTDWVSTYVHNDIKKEFQLEYKAKRADKLIELADKYNVVLMTPELYNLISRTVGQLTFKDLSDKILNSTLDWRAEITKSLASSSTNEGLS